MLCHKLSFHGECRYTECVVMLSVMYAEYHKLAFMLSAVMPSVVKLSVVMPNVVTAAKCFERSAPERGS
jgi:hypothetical protein